MKLAPLVFLVALGVLVAAPACSHLDLTPEGDPERVLDGAVNLRSDLTLPPDTVVVVRVIDPNGAGQLPNPANAGLPVMNQPAPVPMEVVLGEQTITAPASAPIPFHVEYHADDDLLRRGINLDVRVSYGGQVRYRTVNAHLITLSSFNSKHDVWVEAAAR